MCRPSPSPLRRAVHASPSMHRSLSVVASAVRQFGLAVEVAYLGSDISVKFHRSLIAARDRLLPSSFLTPLRRPRELQSISFIASKHSTRRAASCTKMVRWDRPLLWGTPNAASAMHLGSPVTWEIHCVPDIRSSDIWSFRLYGQFLAGPKRNRLSYNRNFRIYGHLWLKFRIYGQFLWGIQD